MQLQFLYITYDLRTPSMKININYSIYLYIIILFQEYRIKNLERNINKKSPIVLITTLSDPLTTPDGKVMGTS